jgi:hypothetical protein
MSGSSASKSSTSSNVIAQPSTAAAGATQPHHHQPFSIDLRGLVGGSSQSAAAAEEQAGKGMVHDAMLDLLLQDSSKYADKNGESAGLRVPKDASKDAGKGNSRKELYARGASVDPDSARRGRYMFSPPPQNHMRHGSVPVSEEYLVHALSPPPAYQVRHASVPEAYLLHTPQVPKSKSLVD